MIESKAITSMETIQSELQEVFGVQIFVFWRQYEPSLRDAVFESRNLSNDEIERAENYNSQNLRARYVSDRFLLRRILSMFCPMPTKFIKFQYGPYGKPYIVSDQNPNMVQFNMSHSPRVTAVCISFGIDVGVDIEPYRSIKGMEDIIAKYGDDIDFRRFIGMRQQRDREEYFIRWWTSMEAQGKAVGIGLRIMSDLKREQVLCVTLSHDDHALSVAADVKRQDRNLDANIYSSCTLPSVG